MRCISCKFVFLMTLVSFCKLAPAIDVSTKVGTITGIIEDATFNGTSNKVAKFLGIPYAEPPTGLRRFKKPVSKTNLKSPFNATFLRASCPQNYELNIFGGNETYDEDCLVLNIYVPIARGGRIDVHANRAVMVWIHGGGFVVGGQNSFDGGVLSTFNVVIIVTMNYRLSVFGFLSTGDSASLGNYGLWDQQLAIRWVHDNIAAFGGDAGKVTIFGESAGSASVIYQSLYPGNKGLFKRVLGESGTPLSPWAFREYNNFQKQIVFEFGRNIGCTQTRSQSLVECLRTKSADELVSALRLNQTRIELGFQFVPTVDGQFLKTSPDNIFDMQNDDATEAIKTFGSFDFMTGVNNKEGGYSVGAFENVLKRETNRSFEDGCPKDFFDNVVVPNVVLNKFYRNITVVDDAIKFFYTDWNSPFDVFKTREMLVDLNSDFIFFAPAIKTINTHVFDTNTTSVNYFYVFSHEPHNSAFTLKWLNGTTHGGEIIYVFGMKYVRYPSEIALASQVMTAFTNFAKTGNPNMPVATGMTSPWPKYDMTQQQYYVFSTNKMTSPVQQRFAAGRMHFWNELVPELVKLSGNTQSSSFQPIQPIG